DRGAEEHGVTTKGARRPNPCNNVRRNQQTEDRGDPAAKSAQKDYSHLVSCFRNSTESVPAKHAKRGRNREFKNSSTQEFKNRRLAGRAVVFLSSRLLECLSS